MKHTLAALALTVYNIALLVIVAAEFNGFDPNPWMR